MATSGRPDQAGERGRTPLPGGDISPARPPCCPYTPSCSTYAVKALHRHGALRGGFLVLGRLLRCRGRRDPVPPARRPLRVNPSEPEES
ncbi:membrane protein insertion efficiency factor YidD [Streptomyces niveus]|uniref:membrane protein insertion efficiency factor YidD n=1 Tax=Streptomyces niveus TaxID=193462 RepID=UPI003429E9BF